MLSFFASTPKWILRFIWFITFGIFFIYFAFNVCGFAFSYVKLIGLADAVQQTVIENNYIPEAEAKALLSYMKSLETPVLRNIRFSTTTEEQALYTSKTARKQYGSVITVGIEADFYFSNPLSVKEITGGVEGFNGTASTGDMSASEIERALDERIVSNEGTGGIRCPIKLEFKVIGLKYYADLDMG